MKNIFLVFISCLVVFSTAIAKNVTQDDAKKVAANFISQNYKLANADLTLVYTEKSSSGEDDYFVFNINPSGFIIISAEDAGFPVIGYSTETTFESPSATSNPNFVFWMNGRKDEIEYIRQHHFLPTDEIKDQWNIYTNNLKNNTV